MDVAQIWALISGLLPTSGLAVAQYVLMALGSFFVIAGAYVKITPTQDDDAWYAKLEAMPILGSVLSFLVEFSPLSRKA